ncbi:M23 family metallopeptidase [Solimicrobium silvestre]|uniref:Membrane proteins related to metalloendopeptidase n=1 Tax=Solimicrobium silvestre TaxID=2099400 RepID=A0A2S9H5D2_9BURK|nr:M23 family metallopeptidase [Solimicrobium silvestre]PRC95195.1 Membrane proteins related to metalloendopeptidase [Solimicrobium silvestre]
MQIIVMHPRFTRAKSIKITQKHVYLALFGLTLMVVVGSFLLSLLCLRLANYSESVRNLLPVEFSAPDSNSQAKYMKQNLAKMAIKLGEMQAQVMQLDALGERVQGLAGVKPEEFNFKNAPPRGGIAPSANAPTLSMSEFQTTLDALSIDLDRRSDFLNVVETTLMEYKVRSRLLPTSQPVNVTFNSSSFGWRLDPFTGQKAFHEGLDFPAPVGTPIVAAAGGVVITAEYHPQFGNMLEIDHGNDLVTRYAHCSRILAKVGDIVKRGQHVADIGTSGRSTGAHLHFEVLLKGRPQNPNKFLMAGANQANPANPVAAN